MSENIIHRLWLTTPPVTRAIFILSTLTSFLVYVNIISPFTLQYSTYYICKMQLWRLVTCFFYFGKLNIETFFHILFLCRYSKMLEENMLFSEFVYMIGIIMGMLYGVNIFVYIRLSHALSAVITYLWARKNPFSHVQYMGCIVLHAFYLPFIVPMYSLLSERRIPRDDFVGILVGHLMYYFKYIWPKVGRDFLKTPKWLLKMFNEYVEENVVKKDDENKVDIMNNANKKNEAIIQNDKDDIVNFENSEQTDEDPQLVTESSSSLRDFEGENLKSNSIQNDSSSYDDLENRQRMIADSESVSNEVASSECHETPEKKNEVIEDSSDILEEKFGEQSDDFEEW